MSTLRAVPQVFASKRRSQRGWIASYVMSYDKGRSWYPSSRTQQKWRPWAWWAVATANRMAARVNAKNDRYDRRSAQEYRISRKMLDSQ